MKLSLVITAIHRALKILLALLALAALTAHGQDKPDEIKQRVLAQARNLGADDYAFTRTVKSETTSNGKVEHHVNVEKYDPTKPGNVRWSLVSVDGAPPSADILAAYNKASPKRRVPGYYRLAQYFSTASTVSTDSRGRTVFHFNSLPKDSALVMDSDVSSNTSSEVTVANANGSVFAEQVHLSVRPMRLKLIMKLDQYESTARYRIGPEGKPLLVEHTADMSGSGLGQEGKVHTVATYTDYRAVK